MYFFYEGSALDKPLSLPLYESSERGYIHKFCFVELKKLKKNFENLAKKFSLPIMDPSFFNNLFLWIKLGNFYEINIAKETHVYHLYFFNAHWIHTETILTWVPRDRLQENV